MAADGAAFTPIATGVENILGSLQREGYRILLAHPERCPAFHRDPEMLEALVAGGVLTSITAGSLVGQFGGDVRRFALGLVRDGLVHNVASDAHDHVKRPPQIAAELERAGLAPLTDWLTRAVPTAILSDGASIPPRPNVELAGAATSAGGCAGAWADSGELRDRHDHPDQHEHDDRDLRPDPEWRHDRRTAYLGGWAPIGAVGGAHH